MSEERDLIRQRIDIIDLVNQAVPLKRMGKNWKGLCPFHPDKNPSFYVSPETGRYRCWSCGEAGDIFDWVMKTQGVDFPEAMEILARRAGIELKPRSAPNPQAKTFVGAMASAQSFFVEALSKNSGAVTYCEGRGLDPETRAKWGIGYSPDDGESLTLHLKRAGFVLSEAKSLFLVDGEQNSGYRDKFRNRLMFPIRDERGTVVAFGGRALGDVQPKYINSSDTPLFRKSLLLYGFDVARPNIAKSRQAVLVEGYMDVIACHRAGANTAVASLGTSLTEDQARILKKWCDEVVILYDGDNAGQKAAERAIAVLREASLRVTVAPLGVGDDPDTLLKKQGVGAVRAVIENRVGATQFLLERLIASGEVSDPGFWSEAVRIAASAESPPELELHVDRLVAIYPKTRDAIRARQELRDLVAAARKPAAKVRKPSEVVAVPTSFEMRSDEVVIFAGVISEELRGIAWPIASTPEAMLSEAATRLSDALRKAFPDAPERALDTWFHRLEDDEAQRAVEWVLQDIRAERLSEPYLRGAIDSLQRAHGTIAAAALREKDDPSKDELRNLHEKLAKLKGKYEKVKGSEETLW